MAISGRRQQVLDAAVAALQDEGIRAIGLQVWPHPKLLAQPRRPSKIAFFDPNMGALLPTVSVGPCIAKRPQTPCGPSGTETRGKHKGRGGNSLHR